MRRGRRIEVVFILYGRTRIVNIVIVGGAIRCVEYGLEGSETELFELEV